MNNLIIKKFEKPDETRLFKNGKFELLFLPDMTLGRATYQPGWKWSDDVSPLSGTKFCNVEHLGMVLEGSASVVFQDGIVRVLDKGDVFYVPPVEHDSWVIGNQDYVSIHFLGADNYTR